LSGARNQVSRPRAERTSINAPMQGTASDIIIRATIVGDRWIRTEVVTVRMIMQVHDKLVFEVAESVVDAVGGQVRGIMQGVADLAAPLLVEVGAGANWKDAPQPGCGQPALDLCEGRPSVCCRSRAEGPDVRNPAS